MIRPHPRYSVVSKSFVLGTALLFIALVITARTEAQENLVFSSVEERATALDYYFQQIRNSEDSPEEATHLNSYFQAFPDNFEEFKRIYDDHYDNNWNLIAESLTQHDLFYLLPKLSAVVSTEEYYTKMLGVGIGGIWDADNINMLQNHILDDLVPQNVALSVRILDQYTTKEIHSFWYFLYDGPHPDHPYNKERFDRMYPEIRKINSRVAEQLRLAYELLISRPGHFH